MATGYIAGIFGTGGSSPTPVPVVVSGSPFADYDALETWSQANPSELLNNESFYATAELDDGTNYQWEGADGVYSANGWIRVNGLNNEEQDAVDSIVNTPDNEILVTGEGTEAGTLVSKGITVSDTDINTNGRSITVSVGSVNLGGAQSISAAGRNVATKDLVSQDSRHSVWQTFEDGNTAAVRVRTTLPPITVSDKTADLVNPVWTQAAATVDQTVKQVVLDFTNAVTNFVVELDIGGVNFFKENLGDFAAGEQTVILNPPTDVFQGDVVTFRLSSEDGDVTVKGNSGTGIPYQVATIASWVDESISGSGDVTGPSSSVDTELAVFNGATGSVIEGTTNITAAVGQNNAKLDISTTNNANDPEIWFNGASSQQEGWIYLNAGTNTFNVRGANGASYTAGTKLDIECDSGDIDINTQTSQINITAQTNALLSSGSGNTTVLSNAGNVQVGGQRILLGPNADVYVNSLASEATGFAVTIEQGVTNGGTSEIVAGNRNPNGNVAATNKRIYLRSGSGNSDLYVGVGTSNTDWKACGGRGSPWQWGNSGVNSGNNQRFMTPGIDFNDGAGTNEGNLVLPITRDGYFQRMRVRHNDPNGNGNNIVYTLRVNGSNSALSVTLASDSTVSSNNGTRVAVSTGDTVSIGVTKPQGGVNNSPNNVNVQIDFY